MDLSEECEGLALQLKNFQDIMQNMGAYVFTKDLEGKYTFVNELVRELFDYPLEEIIGFDDSKFFSLELSNDIKINDRKVMSEGIVIESEEKNIIAKTGETRYYLSVKKPLFDDEKNIVGMFGVSTDITEQKRSERHLHETIKTEKAIELRKNLALQAGTVGIWEWDYSDNTLVWDNMMYAIYGLDPSIPDNPYTMWSNAVDPNDKLKVEANLFNARETNGEYNAKFWISTPNHGRRYIHAIGKNEFDENDTAIRMVGINTDITELKILKDEIDKEREKYKNLLQYASDGVFILNLDGKLLECSQKAAQLLGYSMEEMLTLHIYDWDISHTKEEALIHVRNTSTELLSFKTKHRRKDGSIYDAEISVKKISINSEDVVYASVRDITEINKVHHQLAIQKQEQEKLLSLFDKGDSVLFKWNNDANWSIAYVSDNVDRLLGYEKEAFVNGNVVYASCILEEDLPHVFEEVQHAVKTNSDFFIHDPYRIQTKEGDVKWVLDYTVTQKDDKGNITHFIGYLNNITEIKNYERQLERIAHYDSLTGLPNRVLNTDRLRQSMRQAVRRNEEIAVLYLDLDGFKEINDRYGHSVGDKLLITLASHMQIALRESDSLSRLGGDEFVAIISDISDRTMAISVVQRLLAAASQMIRIDDVDMQVSVSIGVVFYPQSDEIDADQLIRQADQAMYEAKQSGKNRFHIFDPDYDRGVREKHQTLERIEQALANNEFVLYYQPKINIRTNELIGVEALIRWQDPHFGLIPPLEFLPIIENHPLAVSIGKWVIHEAITQNKKWQKAGLTTMVSVNVGARQLLQGDFVEQLQTILAQHEDFDPSMLKIEILETSALENIEHAVNVISGCNKIGVHFALDDFGTGYSSLTYLKRLPIVTLKIDQSFVRDMLVDKNDLAILKGIIGLASAFECEILAEGVETYEHGQELLALGCEQLQGYGIARPMPPDQLLEWNTQWSKEHRWKA